MRAVIFQCSIDPAIGLVIDLFLQESKCISIFSNPTSIHEIVQSGLGRRPACDFPNTLQSSALLYYFHMLKDHSTPSQYPAALLKSLLEPAYEELGQAYSEDREHMKLGLVLSCLSHILEVTNSRLAAS